MSTEIKITEAGEGAAAGQDGNGAPSETSVRAFRINDPYKYAIVWICTIVGFVCALVYSHYGADFTGISYMQFYGFICATIASFLFLFAGMVGCLLYCHADTTHYLSLKLMAVMILELCFCVAALVFLVVLPLPTYSEFKEFVLTGDEGVFNRALFRIEQEVQCCGVDNYTDYDHNNNGKFPIPIPCCDITHMLLNETNCVFRKWENGTAMDTKRPMFYWGCYQKIASTNQIRVEELRQKAPKFCQLMQTLRYLVIVLIVFSVVYLVVIFMYFYPSFRDYLEDRQDRAFMKQMVAAGVAEDVSNRTRSTPTTASTYTIPSYSTVSFAPPADEEEEGGTGEGAGNQPADVDARISTSTETAGRIVSQISPRVTTTVDQPVKMNPNPKSSNNSVSSASQ